MKKFLLLHVGFEQPTPEIMEKWGKWFEMVADKNIEQGGFGGGVEISKSGTKELTWDKESMTGFNIIEAEDLAAAKKIAEACPYISSIRVYEIRSM